MMMLFENLKVCEAIKPQTGGSARSGDWVSLKNYDGCLIVVHIGQGNAATTALTVDKATAVDGTGNSDGITMNRIWKLEDTPTTADAFTVVTAAASVTTSATGTGSSIYVIDVAAAELGAYDCIQLEAGASNASNYISAMYYLYRGRYNQAAMPTGITD